MSFFFGEKTTTIRAWFQSSCQCFFFWNITDSARNIVRFCWDDHGIYFMAYTNHKVVFVVFIMSNGLFQFPIVFLIYFFLSIPYFMIFHELCFMFFFLRLFGMDHIATINITVGIWVCLKTLDFSPFFTT